MLTGRTLALGLLSALGLFGAIGCGPDNRAMQIQALQEDKDRLEAENADLRSRLAAAMRDADEARRRALQLQAMLDDANSRLAQRPASLPPEWEGTDRVAWIDIAENILFDSGKIDLKSTARSKLQEVVSTIRNQPTWAGREVWVIGHTDNEPIRVSKWKDNLDLSVNRGAAVVRELWKMGLDRERLVAAGQGEYKPRVPNSSRSNMSQNRRITILTVDVPPPGTGARPMREDTGPGQTHLNLDPAAVTRR